MAIMGTVRSRGPLTSKRDLVQKGQLIRPMTAYIKLCENTKILCKAIGKKTRDGNVQSTVFWLCKLA